DHLHESCCTSHPNQWYVLASCPDPTERNQVCPKYLDGPDYGNDPLETCQPPHQTGWYLWEESWLIRCTARSPPIYSTGLSVGSCLMEHSFRRSLNFGSDMTRRGTPSATRSSG